jgi:hypothetical protein
VEDMLCESVRTGSLMRTLELLVTCTRRDIVDPETNSSLVHIAKYVLSTLVCVACCF